MSICLRYAKSKMEAQEILNDSFLKVFIKIEKYNVEKSFKGWLRRILINTALDNYRKYSKHYYLQNINSIPDVQDNNVDVQAELAYEDLLAIIQQLSPAYRTIFNLYVIDGFKHEEIAEKLNISVGTSKSNLSKARENIRILIKKNDQESYAKFIG